MNKKRFIIVVFTLFLGVGVILSVNHQEDRQTPETEIQEVFTPYHFSLNETGVYNLKYKQFSKNALFDLHALSQNSSIEGVLNVKVKSKDRQGVWLALQLSHLLLKTPYTKVQTQEIKNLYAHVFYLKLDENGGIIDLFFTGERKNFIGLEQLVYLLDQENFAYKYYEKSQSDYQGDYEAHYHRSTATIQRNKVRYSYLLNDEFSLKIASSEANTSLREGALWFETLKLDETLHFMQDNALVFSNTNHLDLSKSVADPDQSLEVFKDRRSIQEIRSFLQSKPKKQTTIWQKFDDEKERAFFEKNKIVIGDIEAQIVHQPKDINNYLVLARYLKMHPYSAQLIEEKFETYEDEMQMKLIATLQKVNNTQTDEVLIRLAQNSALGDMNQIRAIVALGGLKKASIEVMDTLLSINSSRSDARAQDLSDTALLSASILSKQLAQGVVENVIVQNYERADTLSQTRNTLYAMQNFGADAYVDILSNEINSESKINRKIAIKVISTMKDQSTKTMLLEKRLDIENNLDVKELLNQLLTNKALKSN